LEVLKVIRISLKLGLACGAEYNRKSNTKFYSLIVYTGKYASCVVRNATGTHGNTANG